MNPLVKQILDIADRSDMLRADLEAESGVAWSTMRYWRTGKRSPTLITLEAVANALGYDVELVKRS